MLFSRRFWSKLMAAHHRVKLATAAYEACYGRLKASHGLLTEPAQRELLLEYQLATAELVDALNSMRAFQVQQKRPSTNGPSRRRSRGNRTPG